MCLPWRVETEIARDLKLTIVLPVPVTVAIRCCVCHTDELVSRHAAEPGIAVQYLEVDTADAGQGVDLAVVEMNATVGGGTLTHHVDLMSGIGASAMRSAR